MSYKRLTSAVVLLLFSAASLLRADRVEGPLVAHAVAPYPDAVPLAAEPRVQLTKAAPDAVRKFFTTRKLAEDRIEPCSSDTDAGWLLSLHGASAGDDRSLPLVRIESVKANAPTPSPALTQLRNQVRTGRHSQKEYDAVVKEYADLATAYYREIPVDGQYRNEGAVIFEKYYREAYPETPTEESRPKSAAMDKKRKEEFKARMMELKAQGDYKGMMALSQEARNASLDAAGTPGAMAQMNRETWDIWIRCLKDLRAAAYRTRITYEPGTLRQ